MSKWSDRKKHLKLLGKWKLVDDYSGFDIKSTQISIHHRGFVGTKNHIDPKHPTEFTDIKWPIERPIPFARLEGPDYFINPGVIPTKNWEDVDSNWETLSINWEDL